VQAFTATFAVFFSPLIVVGVVQSRKLMLWSEGDQLRKATYEIYNSKVIAAIMAIHHGQE